MGIAEGAQHLRRDLGRRELVGSEQHGSGKLAGSGGRLVLEPGRGQFECFGLRHQPRAIVGQPVTRLAPFEQGQAERFLERGQATDDRGLAHLELFRGGQRAAIPRGGEEIAHIAPLIRSHARRPRSSFPQNQVATSSIGAAPRKD